MIVVKQSSFFGTVVFNGVRPQFHAQCRWRESRRRKDDRRRSEKNVTQCYWQYGTTTK